MRSYPSQTEAPGRRFAIVVARFNHLVTVRLLEGCVAELEGCGVAPEDVHVAWVPGAFEIPLACRALAETGRYAGVIALGAVIRGGTPHFDYVCRAVTDGVRQAAHETGIPVAFGVLTTDDIDQAMARAGGSQGHKGQEAAAVALEMARLIPVLKAPPGESGPSS